MPKQAAQRTIFLPTVAEPYAAGAARVATTLAEHYGRAPVVPDSGGSAALGRLADKEVSALVVLGVADPGVPERIVHAELASQIASSTRHPVLMVPLSAVWPVRRAVAGMDFGRAAITATLAAAELVTHPAHIALAFVESADRATGPRRDGEPPPHVRLLFDALPAVLREQEGLSLAPHLLKGIPADALLKFAGLWGADLIAIGRHGRSSSPGMLAMPVGPNVRTILCRAATSVLVSEAA